MERDSHEILLDEAEVHFINMKEFARLYNDEVSTGIDDDMLIKWLMLITAKDINDKDALRAICVEDEIMSTVDKLSRLSADQVAMLSYQRRMDNLFYYNRAIRQSAEKDKIIAEQNAALAAVQAAHAAAQAAKNAAQAEAAKLRAELEAIKNAQNKSDA